MSRRKKILVVEDDNPLRHVFRTALTLAGFDVREAGDGYDALQIVDADSPDAIVLDLGLPRINGRVVHEEIRAHADTRRIPVIIVTGDVHVDISQLDADCVLTKPVMPDELVEVVRKCLASSARS